MLEVKLKQILKRLEWSYNLVIFSERVPKKLKGKLFYVPLTNNNVHNLDQSEKIKHQDITYRKKH